ncbi:MAG TPA: hypothetical protein VMT56_02160 [Candidatus Bathyarchaeia archaeon]|nr:hypothetical protein [Candidatus Bathyarchaeia archaeon]
MKRRIVRGAVLLMVLTIAACPGFSQASAALQNHLKQNLGLSQDQINSIHNGEPFAEALPSRSPAEVFVFGVIYIDADPASYVKYAYDFNLLRSTPGYLAINQYSNPPQLSDLKGFALGSDDIQALKNCEPGNCAIQLPGGTITDIQKAINWSAPNVDDQVNQFIQKTALSRMQLYQQQGDKLLGEVYNDKKQEVNVSDQFKYILSYAKALPQNVPEFYNYIVNYPQSKSANMSSMFYWENVKFGLKPTLRIVQVMTMKGTPPQQPAYVIAEKQLYASHYFETSLDLTYCISGNGDPKQPGFFLVKVMGSEQAGLTGMKGSIVRRVAVSHSVTDMQKGLASAKQALEQHQ